jgi:YVTN family beta-propeller protein
MASIIKSSQSPVNLKDISGGDKVGSFKQSLWKHLLSVLFLLLFIGMSWSMVSAQTIRAYVTNFNTGTVSVIDTANNTELTTIAVGSHPIAVVTNPDATRAFVANQNSSSVSVINTASNMVIQTIAVGLGPTGIAITPDGASVYVTNQGDNTVSVINTSTYAVTTISAISGGFAAPFAVAISPDGRAYVTNVLSRSVSVINTATNTLIANIAVGVDPWAVAISPNGSTAYVANTGSDTVSVIDTTSFAVTTINVGDGPIALAVTPGGTRVYVANQLSNNVSVINTADNTVITIPVGYFPSGVAITPDGASVYVTNQGSGYVSVIATATNTVTHIIPTTGSCPFGIVITVRPVRQNVVTAASVSVSGRVIDARRRGISRATVNLTDQNGDVHTARTNSFGYYSFKDVAVGQTYIINVYSKRYQFNPQVISLTENLGGLNFTAQ